MSDYKSMRLYKSDRAILYSMYRGAMETSISDKLEDLAKKYLEVQRYFDVHWGLISERQEEPPERFGRKKNITCSIRVDLHKITTMLQLLDEEKELYGNAFTFSKNIFLILHAMRHSQVEEKTVSRWLENNSL